jgi:hypothetical protein
MTTNIDLKLIFTAGYIRLAKAIGMGAVDNWEQWDKSSRGTVAHYRNGILVSEINRERRVER